MWLIMFAHPRCRFLRLLGNQIEGIKVRSCDDKIIGEE